jgi:hypothetical protein
MKQNCDNISFFGIWVKSFNENSPHIYFDGLLARVISFCRFVSKAIF